MSMVLYLTTLFTPVQCSEQSSDSYSGIGTANTHLLNVSSPWELSWEATGSGNINIAAYKPNSTEQLGIVYANLKNGSRHGSTVVYDISGTIYLTIDSAVDVTWIVSVVK